MQQDIRKTVYEFLVQYIDANGYPPSIREIAKGCFSSPMTVSSTLGILEAQGKITRTAGKARSICIVRETQA
jgi:SOS-response transcriptional repressor LexA